MTTFDKLILAIIAVAIGGLLALAFMSSGAHAKTTHRCVTSEQISAQAKSDLPNVVISTVNGKMIANVLSRYNAEPPASNVKADQILVFQDETLPKIAVYFFLKNCFQGSAGIPKDRLSEFMGDPA